jgi:hypothetical protein
VFARDPILRDVFVKRQVSLISGKKQAELGLRTCTGSAVSTNSIRGSQLSSSRSNNPNHSNRHDRRDSDESAQPTKPYRQTLNTFKDDHAQRQRFSRPNGQHVRNGQIVTANL